ncbi:MAG: outer membrane protein [Pseudomonadota bacterium]
MRRLLSALGMLALTATASFAADLPRQMPTKAPVVYAPAYNWTGFYLGINGGYGWGRSSWDGFGSGSFNTNGGLVGGTAGYNWQGVGSPWVVGLEGDIDWVNIRGSYSNALCASCETKSSWLATVRGRLGYSLDRVMPYITGGLAVGDIQANRPGFAGTSETRAGWTIGGGIEAAIVDRWTGKLEYLYTDLGTTNCSAVSCGLTTDVPARNHLLRAGLNYRF